MKASLGTVRYASGQIAKRYKQNVKISTPSATIGVRGTDFIMTVDEFGGSNDYPIVQVVMYRFLLCRRNYC